MRFNTLSVTLWACNFQGFLSNMVDSSARKSSVAGFRHRFGKYDLLFLIALAIPIFGTLFLLPATPFFYEGDHLIFLSDVMRMLGGEVIYRDFFQFTFPGTHLIYYGLFRIFGVHFAVLNWTILFIGVAGAFFCLELSRRVIGHRYLIYLAPTLYLLFGFRWLGIDGSHRMFSPLAIAAAVLVLLDKCNWQRLVAAGALCALASFFTQHRGVIAVSAISLFLLGEAFAVGRNWRKTLFSLVYLNASFVIVLGLLCAYFIFSVGFDTFYQSTVVFLQNYRADTHNNFDIFLREMPPLIASRNFLAVAVYGFYYFIVPPAFVAVFIVFIVQRRRADWTFWRKPLLLATVGGILMTTTIISPSIIRLYQISILSVVLVVWLLDYFFGARKLFRAATFALYSALIILALMLTLRNQRYPNLTVLDTPVGRTVFLDKQSAGRYLWLKDHTVPGDFVYETYQPTVNFPLFLKNPTRMPLIRDSAYTPPEQIAETVEKLRENPPKYILWDKNWSKPKAQRAPDDSIAPLYEYLLENYQPVAETYDLGERVVEIWERKNMTSVSEN